VVLTHVGQVGTVQVPVSVVIGAQAEGRGRAVAYVHDPEAVGALGQVVVDDHKLVRLGEEPIRAERRNNQIKST